MSAVMSCDVCGENKPVAWRGVAYGTETAACAECAYGVQGLCSECERRDDECVCEVPA